MLTEEDKNLISQIACDLETGNHLLRPRSDAWRKMAKEFNYAQISQTKTLRQKEILSFFKSCHYN